MLISISIFYLFEWNASQYKMKPICSQLYTLCIQVKHRRFKGSFFQSAIKNSEAALFKDKQLQVSTGFIDKDKRVATFYLAAQLTRNDPTK